MKVSNAKEWEKEAKRSSRQDQTPDYRSLSKERILEERRQSGRARSMDSDDEDANRHNYYKEPTPMPAIMDANDKVNNQPGLPGRYANQTRGYRNEYGRDSRRDYMQNREFRQPQRGYFRSQERPDTSINPASRDSSRDRTRLPPMPGITVNPNFNFDNPAKLCTKCGGKQVDGQTQYDTSHNDADCILYLHFNKDPCAICIKADRLAHHLEKYCKHIMPN
jgi:hypothetical protein